uniref:uncharacterized protein n=1 Tax=Centroberyx gerrardi TaxID=166262 RepID=UPI003AAB1635
MVLGATRSEKSTLINGMINYILGIEWNDSFRFKLVDEGQLRLQAESQIYLLFTSAKGVSEIDAVCFVTQASLPRLTATQRYVFESVLSIFGKDVAENIRMLVTFADGQQPPVLEAVNVSGVPCPKTDRGLYNVEEEEEISLSWRDWSRLLMKEVCQSRVQSFRLYKDRNQTAGSQAHRITDSSPCRLSDGDDRAGSARPAFQSWDAVRLSPRLTGS